MNPNTDVEKMLASLSRYCRSISPSAWDAEDLLQETCLRALSVVSGQKSHPNAVAYLLRIAKNVSIDQARRRQTARAVMERHAPAARLAEPASEDGDSAEMENALGLLVRHLSSLQLTVFLLREVFGYTGAEAAQALRTSEGAVKAALNRARSTVRSLKERLPAFEDGEALDEGEKDLVIAYLSAIRHANPQSAVLLAMAQNGQLAAVRAAGSAAGIRSSAASGTAAGSGASRGQAATPAPKARILPQAAGFGAAMSEPDVSLSQAERLTSASEARTLREAAGFGAATRPHEAHCRMPQTAGGAVGALAAVGWGLSA